jgi:zeta-carotene desaturase
MTKQKTPCRTHMARQECVSSFKVSFFVILQSPPLWYSPRPLMANPTILIIGGGVAGIAAAVALESAGLSVTLIEARKSLGGRASSFIDPKSNQEIDNCQHVLLGCCTNLLDLYRRLKCDHLIRFEKTITFRDEKGEKHGLSATPGFPAPTHLSASFATFGILTLKEKIAYSRAMLAMLRLGRSGRAALMDVPFGQWLDEHKQPQSLITKMYEPVLVGALNEDCRKCSATYAIQVFQDAMLAHAKGYVVGVPTVPLSQLYGEHPCRDTRLGVRVDELLFEGNKITGATLTDGQQLTADAVILATNHHAVQKWIPPKLAATDDRFKHLDQLQSVPILGVHLQFDRPVLTDPHAALITGPLQWLFKKDTEGKVISGVISASRDYIGRPKEDCLKEFEAQVRSALPEAAGAKLIHGTIVIEKRATFAPRPGIDRLRPHQAPPPGGIQNLYLAGDYTQTGWPATMEGAVRSGYLAADAVLNQLDHNNARPSFLRPDLPTQWPARLLGL